jgi:hypothetical protein
MEGGDGVAIRFIFEILDRDYIEKVRQERGYGINPWDDLSKVSYCCSSVRPTLVRFAPGSTISDLPACSFLTKLTMRLRLAADRCRKATFKAPGSPVRGTVRISTSKPALFWGSVTNRYKRLQRTTLHLTGIASREHRDEPMVQL